MKVGGIEWKHSNISIVEQMNRSIWKIILWHRDRETYLLKLQRMQNNVLRTTGNFPRFTTVRDLQAAFNFPDVYDYTWSDNKVCELATVYLPWQQRTEISV
jgi:hypothetical protein